MHGIKRNKAQGKKVNSNLYSKWLCSSGVLVIYLIQYLAQAYSMLVPPAPLGCIL